MVKARYSSQLRNRQRALKSDKILISWAKKQKQKYSSINISSTSCAGQSQPTLLPVQNLPLRCPLVGCIGAGHVNGIELTHITLSGCPMYHNVPFEKWAEMRAREEGLVSPIQAPKQPSLENDSPIKLTSVTERRLHFRTTLHEPPVEDLANAIEIYQFRCAQQRLLSRREHEAREHLLTCARIAAQSAAKKDSMSDSLRNVIQLGTVDNPEVATKQHIRSVFFDGWELQPIYQSQYPADIACLPEIYVCAFCLAPLQHRISYVRHQSRCTWFLPPGDEIYRKDPLSFFEVDGQKHPDYCRNLCLLTKLFLKQKTVHEVDQVTSFLFYVLTESNESGFHMLGYFSKQKAEDQDDPAPSSTAYNNLSCLLILPQHQCRGYGRMLIEMSYILCRMENRLGSPERPLSDLGLISYRKYWRWEILNFLSCYSEKTVTMRGLSQELGIAIPDIVSTLLDMKLLIYYRTQYYIINKQSEINRLLSQMKPPDESRRIDPNCLYWKPRVSVSVTKDSSQPVESLMSDSK